MLILRDLVKVYPGPVAALQGVDLDVSEGMFGLLGPNGAGKSTLMRIIAGLLEPTSGRITLDGVDTLADPGSIRDRLGYLPQDFGFYPHLTGRDMLMHLLRLKGVSAPGGVRKLADALLDRVHLGFAAKRKVRGYSGGMRQRLGVAQAIAGDPRLIIVDEPTAGLDPEERLRFYHLLADLAGERIVLLSTHIVEDVAVLCPRFGVLREGRLIARTSPAEARARIDGAMYEGVVDAPSREEIEASFTVTQALLFEGAFRMRIHAPGGGVPPEFRESTATLEDAYLVLMRSNGDSTGEGAAAMAEASS